MAYTYDGCCGSCIYMNTNDYTGHKDHCYCTYRRQYYNLTDSKCRYYQYDPHKDYYDLSHRWHIVSAIIKKLELSDEYECIAVLHDFRINYLENDKRFIGLLKIYDLIGPIIAKCITEDEESVELCKKLTQKYLVNMLDKLRNKEYEDALSEYISMINILSTIYESQIKEYLDQKLLTEDKKASK